MATNSALFTPLYAPGLRKIVFDGYAEMPTEYDKFLNVSSVDKRQYLDDYKMGGFGTVPTKAEGTSIVYDDPVPGSTVRYSWTPYGKGFRVTHEAMVDELYGPMRRMAKAMGRSFRNQVEVIGAGLLNNAFSVANGGFDGKALCASDHPLLRGGTARNRPTAFVDFGVTALQDALIDFERMVDDSGFPISYRAKYLVIPPETWTQAREVLGSQFKPYTSDNEINTLANEGLTLVVSHYMTDTDAWFLLADKSDHDLQFFHREKFTTDAADDFDTGDGKMKGYMRNGVGYGDWRGVWGSQGI
jgi:hypothetical protein